MLYRAVADLPDEDYRRELGGYFDAIHAKLNHLLSMDRPGASR
ncbi:hypothetical protein [Geminicoccus roseus]|nr:hypothetical protein [Geminicoccus roseus]